MNVIMYGVTWCGDCRAARKFLDSHGIKYSEIDIDPRPCRFGRVGTPRGQRAIPQLVIDGEWFQPYKPGYGLLFDELHQRLRIPNA